MRASKTSLLVTFFVTSVAVGNAFAMSPWDCTGLLGGAAELAGFFDRPVSEVARRLRDAGYSTAEVEDVERWRVDPRDYDDLRRAGIGHHDVRDFAPHLRRYSSYDIGRVVRAVGRDADRVLHTGVPVDTFLGWHRDTHDVDEAIEVSRLSAHEQQQYRDACNAGASGRDAREAIRTLMPGEFDAYVAARRDGKTHGAATSLAKPAN